MKIQEIARHLDTRILQPDMTSTAAADGVVSSNRMSDLLEHATSTTLIVTALATRQVLDMAELMDAPGVCVTIGAGAPALFLSEAMRCRVPVILSRLSPEETCRRIEGLLQTTRKDRT